LRFPTAREPTVRAAKGFPPPFPIIHFHRPRWQGAQRRRGKNVLDEVARNGGLAHALDCAASPSLLQPRSRLRAPRYRLDDERANLDERFAISLPTFKCVEVDSFHTHVITTQAEDELSSNLVDLQSDRKSDGGQPHAL
jgi:hypothetical protein